MDDRFAQRKANFVPSAVYGGGARLVNERGEPVPPQDVVDRLKKVSPRLGLRWVPGSAFGSSPYFGLTERWKDGDPRWERVRTGELAEARAYDLIQMFPLDCSVPEMAAYIEHRWGERNRSSNPSQDAERIVDEEAHKQGRAMEDTIGAFADESLERSARTSLREKRVRAGAEAAAPMVDVAYEPKRLIPKPETP